MMRVLLVGMGTIGQTHAEVLAAHPDHELVGIADTHRDSVRIGDESFAIFADTGAAVAALSPDLVVVATPTGTHVDVLEQVLEHHPTCSVLIEKPAAASPDEHARLVALLGRHGDHRVCFAHHAAYAPEVLWAARWVERATWLGPLQGAVCLFQDPYAREADLYRARLGSSWLDSGINALSVLERFARVDHPRSHRQLDADGLVEEVVMSLESPRGPVGGLIVTSWHATASAKSTRLTYPSGVELFLDHTAVSGFVSREHRVVARFGTDGRTSRRHQHYRNMYDVVAAGPDALMTWPTTQRLLQSLLAAEGGT